MDPQCNAYIIFRELTEPLLTFRAVMALKKNQTNKKDLTLNSIYYVVVNSK